MIVVTCPYCNEPAVLHKSSERFYHGRDYGPVWACNPCGAYVGCHKNSKKFIPLGRLANSELRAAKIRAHDAFDRLWRGKMRRDKVTKGTARRAAYKWLSEQMKLEAAACHIGMFDVEQCNRVVAICTPYLKAVA